MISLSSDKVMLVASAFLESSLWLACHHRPCRIETAVGAGWHMPRGTCPPSDVYSLTKYILEYLEGVLTPPTKGYCPIV